LTVCSLKNMIIKLSLSFNVILINMTQEQKTKQQAILTSAHFDYHKSLNSYAFFKIHNQATSEDLVQNTFLKTWAYIVKGGQIETMKAFLYHILNNLIIDEYRKHKASSLDDLLEKGFEPGTDTSKQLMDYLDGKSASLLINRLPVKFQKVMQMRYIQDLSLEEMSIKNKQSKNTVAVQLHRGLEKLKLLYIQAQSTPPLYQ